MYYNFWIIFTTILILTTTCYCGKREFFDEPEQIQYDEYGEQIGIIQNNENEERFIEYNDNSRKIISQVNLGTKYTIEDVNKATHAIIKYFGEKQNVNISITKVVSIKNSPNMMQLNLFLYNPIKNIILGYVIDVKIPLTKNEESKILLVKPFSEEEEPNKYNNFNQYSSINMVEGNFT